MSEQAIAALRRAPACADHAYQQLSDCDKCAAHAVSAVADVLAAACRNALLALDPSQYYCGYELDFGLERDEAIQIIDEQWRKLGSHDVRV